MTILIAGGAGYIGSHTCVELISSGYDVVIVDDFSNSKKTVIKRIKEITGRDMVVYENSIRDYDALDKIFSTEHIDVVINFAGSKSVGESVDEPLAYYENNVVGALTLLKAMKKHGIKKHIFSSSATVYGEPQELPITENCPVGKIANPYGHTKAVIERMLMDLYNSDHEWEIALLRYFNPAGAHVSGLIGEDPNGVPNNLMPYISQVAIGKRPYLNVFGDDYKTADGTGVRDYIHVVDLAKGHVAALDKMTGNTGLNIYNLGTGTGYSVLEMLHAFEKACGKPLPYQIAPRRAGDVAACYCDPGKAARELGWKAEKNLDDMCADSWRWQSMNPDGYDD